MRHIDILASNMSLSGPAGAAVSAVVPERQQQRASDTHRMAEATQEERSGHRDTQKPARTFFRR